MKKIKVLVVDDSPMFRSLISEIISSDPALEVVGTAEDPYQARQLIKQLNPDVLTLDIEMPKMNGVQFLKNLMRLRPMPVVMISTLTQHGAEATLVALELGAVDYFPKPSASSTADLLGYRELVNDKIKMAARAQLGNEVPIPPLTARSTHSDRLTQTQLIAIGASTGGTEAVKQVLAALPAGLPPIVITQHISAMFSKAWAARLNAASALSVQELGDTPTPLLNGHVYVAAGDQHLVVLKQGRKLFAQRQNSPPVNRHKPSVDVMFQSVLSAVGPKALGVLLTGMGRDGAEGLLALKNTGATTIAQDEKSSVVWGMPRVAIEIGGAQHVKPLHRIPQLICDELSFERNPIPE